METQRQFIGPITNDAEPLILKPVGVWRPMLQARAYYNIEETKFVCDLMWPYGDT